MPDLSTSTLGAGTVTRAITPDDKARIDRETDARFILQSGIAHKLDPRSAIDRKWIPVWQKLHRDVQDAFANGSLVFTYDHPGVANKVADAVTFTAGAIAGLAGLAAGTIGPTAAQNAKATAKATDDAWQYAKAAATAGATLQAVLDVANAPRNPDAPAVAPPRVDPALVASAAQDVRAATLAGASGGPRAVVTPQDAHAAMASVGAPAQAQVAPQAAAAATATGNALTATTPAAASLASVGGGFPWKIAAGVTAAGIGLVLLSGMSGKRSGGARRLSSRTIVVRGGR